MKKDIRKLGDYLLEVTREGLALERKIIKWEQQEARQNAEPLNKTS